MEFEKQLEEWMKLDYVLPEDLPNIELYMDQVTTFLEEQLKNTKRFEEDKIFTKTMINNYTKNHLLDRKSTRLNSSHPNPSRMPSSA